MTTGKGGKRMKKTTSRGRKVKRLRDTFKWPEPRVERLHQELPCPPGDSNDE